MKAINRKNVVAKNDLLICAKNDVNSYGIQRLQCGKAFRVEYQTYRGLGLQRQLGHEDSVA